MLQLLFCLTHVLENLFLSQTDASGVGLGAIRAQNKEGHVHPIAYASHTLDPHECNYGISELVKFLEVQVDGTLPMCDGKSASQVLLEPRIEAFESMGLRTHESLVSVSGELVLVQNSEGTCVHLEEGMELGVVWCIRC